MKYKTGIKNGHKPSKMSVILAAMPGSQKSQNEKN